MDRPPIRAILAGADLASEGGAGPALETASRLAGFLGADLHVCHAVESGPFSPPLPPALSLQLDAAGAALQAAVAARPAGAPEVTSIHVAAGPAHRVLSDRAAEVGADLLVLGPHRGGVLTTAMLGTTVDRLLRTVPVPCWIARAETELPLRHLTAGFDFSAASRHALDYAFRLAAALGGAYGEPGAPPPLLDVIHVEWTAAVKGEPGRVERVLLPNLLDETTAAGHRTDLDGAALTHARVIPALDPSRGILGYATERGPGLLVLGTHGRGALTRALLGAVATIVAREAPCDVVLVPPPRGIAEG